MTCRERFQPVPYIAYGLSEIRRGFKTFSSRRINDVDGYGTFHWQKSFHDRIIRDDAELQHLRQYIMDNSLK